MGNIARAAGAEAFLLPHRCFTAEGETYLYAAESGGLFRLDDGARDALSALGGTGGATVPPGILSDLRRAGLLGASAGCGPARPAAHPPLRLRTLVLMLTYSCNLACRYCYEDREEGCVSPAEGGGAPKEMSPESLRESVRFLLDHSPGSRKLSIVLFGGEPLLRFPLLRAAVLEARAMANARGKEVSFSITTNGTLLTREIAGFLKENGVSVCISIDGPREVHDANRPYASGRGSYDDVERGIAYLMEDRNGHPTAARVTLGRGAVDVRKTFDHLRGLGFDEVGFAPASAAEGSRSALTGEELDRVLDGFRDLAAEYADDVRERRMPAFSNMTQILALIHRGDPMPYPCGAGIGMLAADPSGILYPCHRLCGVGESMGDPSRGIAEEARTRFLEGARRRRETACDACWAKNFCAGGCYHDAYLRQGDLFAPSVHYCRWIRELFLLGLQTYVRIQNETPTFPDVMLGERGIA
ncbi:MAG: radical SAM protein [bacterium]|jgi:uncharacterized protein